MEGHAGDQRLDFLAGYWTLYVLMSWTVFSKILELVNMLQSNKSTCKSRRLATLTLNISEATTGCIRPFSPLSSFPGPPARYCLPHTHCPHWWDPWAWRPSLRATSASPLLLLQDWRLPPDGAACARGPSLCPQFLVPAGTASFSCLQPPSLSVPLGVWALKISPILKNSSLYFPEDFQPSLPRMVLLMVLLYVRIIVIVFS